MIKALIGELKNYLRAFSLKQGLLLLAFAALSVGLNHYYHIEKQLHQLDFWPSLAGFFLMYAIHVYVGLCIVLPNINLSGIKAQWRMHTLWLLACLLFAFRACFTYHGAWIEAVFGAEQSLLKFRVFNNVFRALYCIVPVFVIWLVHESEHQHFYGLKPLKSQYKLYAYMLLAMLPLIALAACNQSFLSYYPRANKVLEVGGNWLDLYLYELFYGLDFVSIELFFRGFMVIAFIRYVGIYAVLPMSLMYMSIHYGKPTGEAISSFFGGSLLGVMSFYSQSILGGIFVHIGIAWSMEIGASIAHAYK